MELGLHGSTASCCKRDFSPFAQDGDRFWRIPECYVRGNTIKYLRIPDEVCVARAMREGV